MRNYDIIDLRYSAKERDHIKNSLPQRAMLISEDSRVARERIVSETYEFVPPLSGEEIKDLTAKFISFDVCSFSFTDLRSATQ